MRTHVDLFSGIAGFALAARWAGVETIAFAEIDSYASRVIERHFPGVRNYGRVQDVPTIEGVWLVTGGVPCQPASVAGKRRGADDDRWLWPEALAAVERIRPAWVLFENPTGILSLNDGVEFERICVALEGQGYEVQPIVIPACAVGFRHRRYRVWIAAYTEPERRARALHNHNEDDSRAYWTPDSLDTQRNTFLQFEARSGKPAVFGMDDGLPARLDVIKRLETCGNAIVPQIAYQLIKRMIEADER